MTDTSATFETRKDAGDGGPGIFRLWTSALELATKDEKDWRDKASHANERYRDEKRQHKRSQFNILYSSIQTQAPSIYNSTPKPDVRRRFNDKDIVGKLASQAFERTLTHSLDQYDFDKVMTATVHDSLLPGRGVPMVEYEPALEPGDIDQVRTVHVQWDDFRHGPGKQWDDVPWVAVRFRITREDATKLNPKIGPTVNLDYIEGRKEERKDGEAQIHDIFKRLTVWKIWDKAKRQIVFIAPSYRDGPFAVEDDLLGLEGFFPIPRPLYDIEDTKSLTPLVPYEMYRDQAEELDSITARLSKLIKVLRWRGVYPSQIDEFQSLKDLDDGELMPSQSFQALLMSQGSSPDKAIWLMPIDRLIVVIRELQLQREATKQVVFEISGLADIMRGETDPNETLGAQQLKAQWGTVRMQQRQRETQRLARDLFRLQAEIIGEKYSVETLAAITGIELPTPLGKQTAQQAVQVAQAQGAEPPPDAVQLLQLPTWEEVKAVMASDALRSFRVDIESDSTIASDLSRAQQNMSGFVEGLAAFGAAIGPGIESGVVPADVATDLLTAFARNFKLGRQAEDALERLGEQARKPQGQDPAAAAAAAEAQRVQAEAQAKAAEMQAKAQADQQKAALDADAKAREMEMKQVAAAQTEQLKVETASAMLDIERQRAAASLDIERQKAEEASRIKREEAEFNTRLKMTEAGLDPDGGTAKLDLILQTVGQVAEALRMMAAEVEGIKEQADEPISITPKRENGKLVGATRTQGERVTEVTLN